MNKKKHQGEPHSDNSSGSSDELNRSECPHIPKSVDIQKIKKQITKTGFLNDCDACSKMDCSLQIEDAEPDIYEMEFDTSLWLCLKCGNQACGRSKNQHALKHYVTPHSDPHSMCVNTTLWSVWCYECDNEVNVTSRKKLHETVEFLKKQMESKNKTQFATPSPSEYTQVLNTGTTPKPAIPLGAPPNSALPRARGLTNLGNTCFFNSVMQCLGQTPYLQSLLDETSQTGQYFRLPGGKLKFKESNDEMELEQLDGTLDKWRPLTSSLADALQELQSDRAEVHNPRLLLSRLVSHIPQFGGGDQHDSHELLRHLLEAVREEDLKRYQQVILSKLGLSTKTDPSNVDDRKKQIIKFYGQQASDMLTPTEQVFRGVLVSTLQCQVCGHTSHRDENFLDLSLPISEKQMPPILRRKADEIEDNKPSKHQIKKEKRNERKKNRKRTYTNYQLPSIGSANDADNDKKSDSESDADVEDNTEDTATTAQTSKGLESGYNSDKIDNSSPDSNNRGSPEMRIDDSGVPSPVMGMVNVSPLSPASSETNVDMGSPLGGHNSPNEDLETFERPGSRLTFNYNKNSDLKVDLEKLSLLNDADSNRVESLYQKDDNMGDGAYAVEPMDEKMEQDEDEEDLNLWTGTIAPRYQCEEGECSVQSCLNQFTECELLAGTNRVFCELCTKRHGGADKKSVCTDAAKQLLIYNPPAVLILHLKRFQVCRFRSAKVSKHVKFSTLLDLAPFCSKRSQSLPTFEQGQTRVLYSLYGVVEHSGSIHGGHYVAYIKVRSQIDENSYRWHFLPKNQREKLEQATSRGGGMGAEANPESPAGKWYYISDTYVSEVSEAKVLTAQAYLLFYERIM